MVYCLVSVSLDQTIATILFLFGEMDAMRSRIVEIGHVVFQNYDLCYFLSVDHVLEQTAPHGIRSDLRSYILLPLFQGKNGRIHNEKICLVKIVIIQHLLHSQRHNGIQKSPEAFAL